MHQLGALLDSNDLLSVSQLSGSMAEGSHAIGTMPLEEPTTSNSALKLSEYSDQDSTPEALSKEPQVARDQDVLYNFGTLDTAEAHQWNCDMNVINTLAIQTTDKTSSLDLWRQLVREREAELFTTRNPALEHKFISANPGSVEEQDELYRDLEFYESLCPYEPLESYETLGPDEELHRLYEYLEFSEAMCPYNPLGPYPYDHLGLYEAPVIDMTEINRQDLVPATLTPQPSDTSSARISMKTDTRERLTRMLPLLLEGQRMNACADSGASYNTIDISLARKLNCQVDEISVSPDLSGFKLPIFGKKIQPIGKINLMCQFPDEPNTRNDFEFYVFERLISPLIVGRPFLRFTKTLDQFCHRLKALVRPKRYFPLIRYLGSDHERLRCVLEGELLDCVPDTGAEANLMSSAYATARGFQIEDSECGVVQFADGTVQKTLGHTCVRISLGSSSETSSEKFEILDGLEVDVVLGEEILWAQDAFVRHSSSFKIGVRGKGYFDMGPISYLGTLESALVRSKEKLSTKLGRKRSKPEEPEIEREARKLKYLDDQDTLELNRQYYEALRISKLSGLARKLADEEEAWKRKEYEQQRMGMNTTVIQVKQEA